MLINIEAFKKSLTKMTKETQYVYTSDLKLIFDFTFY